LKAAVLANPDPVVEESRLLHTMADRMRAHGFVAAVDPRNLVLARRGACSVKARDYPPTGALRQVFEQLGREVGETRYAYRGRWHAAPPTWSVLGRYYVQRELARAGFATPGRAIVAVSATPSCWASPPAWADVDRWLRLPT
jgi:hypothetical protein